MANVDRRQFLQTLGLASLAGGRFADQPTATLAIEPDLSGPVIPPNFTGLSYEAAQLANPAFFSPGNRELVKLFTGLTPAGNLRIGGGSSEFTTYSREAPLGPAPFEVFGPDTSKTVKHGTTTTTLALRNLRDFLDATNWNCLYGLNLGQGTRENAVAEAVDVFHILGPRLLAFQIGNEPDSFRNRYRPASYGPSDFLGEWNAFHDAIVAKVPEAKFAGPDISNKWAYLTAFATEALKHPDVILLTAHFYAMGPAGNPNATLDQLAQPDPKLATMHRANLKEISEAIATAHLPLRISEANSCWDGGKPGVSDTLASALWCADMMLRFASFGWAGVNLHGGGNGYYTPIAGAPSTGFTKRPEYFGIQFAQALAGSTVMKANLSGAGDQVSAYAFERRDQKKAVVINKADTGLRVNLPSRPRNKALVLTGPALDSKEGTALISEKLHNSLAISEQTVTIAAHTAIIFDL